MDLDKDMFVDYSGKMGRELNKRGGVEWSLKRGGEPEKRRV